MILTVRPAFRCLPCRYFADVHKKVNVNKLTADEIREAISRGDKSLRLVQIPGPPAPVREDNIRDRIRYQEELAQWESVKDIQMPFAVMYDLLSQHDITLKRIVSKVRNPHGMTGHQLFVSENKQQIKATLPKLHDGYQALHQMVRAGAALWRALPEQEKEEYRRRAAILKQQQQLQKEDTAIADPK